jgi:hypothetical protein
LFCSSILAFTPLLESNYSFLAWIIQGLVMTALLIYGKQEFNQIIESMDEHQHSLSQWWNHLLFIFGVLRLHFLDVWNIIDAFVICLGFAGSIARCVARRETNTSRCILSVASIFVYFKFLYFLRAFEQSGPLGTLTDAGVRRLFAC